MPITSKITPIAIGEIATPVPTFPAKKIDVGPSAPPIIDIAIRSFTFRTIPATATRIPIAPKIIASTFAFCFIGKAYTLLR